MWLRSSDIMTPQRPAKSPGARRRTHGVSPESSRWRRALNPRACGLFAGHDCAERPSRDSGHRFLLLFRRQILDELAIRLLQLGIRVELFCDARANSRAALDLVPCHSGI